MFGPTSPDAHQRRLRAFLRWNDKVFTARVANEAVNSLPANRRPEAAYLWWGLIVGGKPTELHVGILDPAGEEIGHLMVRRHLCETVNAPTEFRMDNDLERLYPFQPAHRGPEQTRRLRLGGGIAPPRRMTFSAAPTTD